MDEKTFKGLELLLDRLDERLGRFLESPEILDLLGEISKATGVGRSVELECVARITEPTKSHGLAVLHTGITKPFGEEPYLSSGDSSAHRYVLGGEILMLPHDHCPKCWGEWVSMGPTPHCSSCGLKLGEGCKLLLDSDVCPWCEKGTVTQFQPKCTACGFEVDPGKVTWG